MLHQEWNGKGSGYFIQYARVLYMGKTRYQSIALYESEQLGKVLVLDGCIQVIESDEYHYHEPMVHVPFLLHDNPEDICIIGGGDGGILREVCKYQTVKSIDMVELDGEVIEFSKQFFPEISQGAFYDTRLNLTIGDGRTFIESTNKKFDIIIMDMTDPFGASVMLYTKEFFKTMLTTLKNNNSLFIMHSESPRFRPLTFSSIHATLRSVFTTVVPLFHTIAMYGGLWSFALCSPGSDDLLIPDDIMIQKKLTALGQLKVITPESYRTLFVIEPWIQDILLQNTKIITDADHDFLDLFPENSGQSL